MTDLLLANGLKPSLGFSSGFGGGVCVSITHGFVVVPTFRTDEPWSCELVIHSLMDGSILRRVVVAGKEGVFICRGICVTPAGNGVLLCDLFGNCLHDLDITAQEPRQTRVLGKTKLMYPQSVDCNAKVIVVTDWSLYSAHHSICILSWSTGAVLRRVGSRHLEFPRGVRLLRDGSGVVVADTRHHRLCAFPLLYGVPFPRIDITYPTPVDVIEWDSGGFMAVTDNGVQDRRSSCGRRMERICYYATDGCALARLPDDGLVVRDFATRQTQVYVGLYLRRVWMIMCVSWGT